ncbi:MAG TPA: lactate permease LctP family transporter [Acidobacteriaceae bacterium]|nr:lactate permease LctP family transporter [Acidobacteriaceae bacterium]
MSQIWSQSYTLFGRGLAFSAVIASLPILTLLFLLGVLRKPAWIASLFALFVALVVALFAYQLPPALTLSSGAYGAAFGLFPICWIVFWAIALYQVTVDTGKFEIIKASMGTLTSDARLQALLIAFAFGAFVEGAAGFGTPVAVAAAMLVGLGFSPFYASALCLVANTAPVAFGSIGIPVITLAGITGLPLDKLSGAVGRLCAPLSLFVPCYLVCIMVGWRGMLEVWPAVVVVGGVFASVQFSMSNFVGPQLTDISASLAAMAAMLLLLRFWRPAKIWDREMEPVVPSGKERKFTAIAPGSDEQHSAGKMFAAWVPYGLLVILVLLWGFKPFQALLNTVTMSVGWPLLHNHVLMMPPVVAKPTLYKAVYQLNFLSAAGTACMFSTLLAALFLRMSPMAFGRLLLSVSRQLFLPVLTVASVLAMAFIMNYCGATATLGLAFAASGRMFPFFSPLLGWLGVFLTGSDTSANALFGNLQVVTAGRLGFEPTLMAAANSAGGVVGKMISVQNIAVAAAATAMTVADQARLFRFTLRHSIVMATAIGIEVMLYAYLVHVR